MKIPNPAIALCGAFNLKKNGSPRVTAENAGPEGVQKLTSSGARASLSSSGAPAPVEPAQRLLGPCACLTIYCVGLRGLEP